jgi:hypothetical protein
MTVPLISEQEAVAAFVQHVAKVAASFARQAGVGGMETAGGIISFLARHPEHIASFQNGGVFDLPPDWIERGCLTWHAQNGKIVHPDYARRARAIKRAFGDYITEAGDQ